MENEAKAEKSIGSKEELQALLAEFDTAMLVGTDADGSLRARPMELGHDQLPDCDLWFVTADDTHKTDEIERHREVNVCCLRSRDRAYLSLSARARIDRNPGEARRMWKPSWKLWLGDAQPEDGGIVLLKLEVERAEYWEPDGGRPRVVYAEPSTGGAEDQEGIDIDL